jgi:hypothetical protein
MNIKPQEQKKQNYLKLGWRLWVFLLLCALVGRFFGLIGVLVVWGIWALCSYLYSHYIVEGGKNEI